MNWQCTRHGIYTPTGTDARCPECKKELNQLIEPGMKESQDRIKQLEKENEQLKLQIELADKQQDKLYEKIEDYRELVTLLMKVW